MPTTENKREVRIQVLDRAMCGGQGHNKGRFLMGGLIYESAMPSNAGEAQTINDDLAAIEQGLKKAAILR